MLFTTSLLAFSAPTLILALPRLSSGAVQNDGHPVPAHDPLRSRPELPSGSTARSLKGKFLHITDIHPDPFYKVHSSTAGDSACHRTKGSAGYYGAETSDCDSPLSLVNATFDWLKTHMRDEVDFIVWTGDSARHDNDEKLPRSEKQVVSQNRFVVSKFLEAFGKPGNLDDDDPTNDFLVPIVPTLGNNDILPHNIFLAGPNRWTTNYLDIWKQFIPEHERHQFQRGGWFSVEVIPGKLQVFSLNTLYFFASNSGVDGCANKKEPGFQQFEWLRVQLDLLRARGMKAILIGHVPPARVEAKVSWVESCWQKYALWMRMYRDVVVSGIYGHMNIDHFMIQDWEDVKKHVRKGIEYDSDDEVFAMDQDDEFTIESATDYLVSLRDQFSTIPPIAESDSLEVQGKKKKPKPGFDDIGGEFGERYSISIVGPSLVPNYFPTIRVYSYNVSGLENLQLPAASSFHRPAHDHGQIPLLGQEDLSETEAKHLELRSVLPEYPEETSEDLLEDSIDAEGKKKKNKKKNKKNKKNKGKKAHKFPLPKGPSKTTPPGPAYSPQTLSLLSVKQYFANLTHINNDYVSGDSINAERWKPGKHHGKDPPGKKPTPRNLTFEVEYDTADDEIYALKDLTVRSWLDLASNIAKSKKGGKSLGEGDTLRHVKDTVELPILPSEVVGKKRSKVWFAFVKRAFVGTIEEGDVKDQFGTL